MEIVNALWITLIGMGLVFVAILMLWGLMDLLVRVTAEKEAPLEAPLLVEEEAAPEMVVDALPDAALLLDRKRRAAAAAVAVAMNVTAKLKAPPADEERKPGMVSPWQVINRASQINQRINISRKKVNR